jgi:hypothetical protein
MKLSSIEKLQVQQAQEGSRLPILTKFKKSKVPGLSVVKKRLSYNTIMSDGKALDQKSLYPTHVVSSQMLSGPGSEAEIYTGLPAKTKLRPIDVYNQNNMTIPGIIDTNFYPLMPMGLGHGNVFFLKIR